MGTEYNLTAEEYVKEFSVDCIYELRANNECLAVGLSCEQGKYVFFENFSYNKEYAEYSPGFILYIHYLNRLSEKGKAAVFLGDGHQLYKTYFGGIEDKTYNGALFTELKILHKGLWFYKKLKVRFYEKNTEGS